ncbi:IS110 family transposase [Marivirga tractuosa]|uniref:IS110 family transposase n=1 Tax=Marivirga tractuosa TaxID=1006 RepID=UPI0035D03F9E
MIVGIDTSNDFFDATALEDDSVIFQRQFANNVKGFRLFLNAVKDYTVELVCIEATGPYHLRFAMFLNEHKFNISVVNPLVIKRYAQMKMSRAKTDKKDAYLIAFYAKEQKPELWKAPSEASLEIRQLDTHLELLMKHKRALANQLHAFKSTGTMVKGLEKQMEEQINQLNDDIKKIERKIESLVRSSYQKMADQLQSIPGIGKKSAYMMIVCTNGFSTFDNYKQVISFFGLAPRHYQSGTSVKGKTRICKMGMSRVRKILYMAGVTAIKCNKTCQDLYDRLRAKGKSHNLAIIAVVNKLIKQSFAIAKNNTYYQADYILQSA